MATQTRSVTETRREQMFPVLDPEEIARLKRFGEMRSFRAGQRIAKSGDTSPGLMVLLSGRVRISQTDDSGGRREIVTHGPGAFAGELAQLRAAPPWSMPIARRGRSAGDPERRLRALFVGEAEVGERVMRALILRRSACWSRAGGPDHRRAPTIPTCCAWKASSPATAIPVPGLEPATDAEAAPSWSASSRTRGVADRAVPGRPAV